MPLFFMACEGSSRHEEGDEEEGYHKAGLAISDEQKSVFDIREEIIIPGVFQDVVKVTGEIMPSSSDVSTLTAKKSGIITLHSGIMQGARVKAGEVLGNISSSGLQGGDINEAAKANLEAAKVEYERLKPLHAEGLVTTSVFREAERAYKEASALAGASKGGSSSVVANRTGTISSLLVRSGEFVETGAPVAVVSSNVNMILKADLPVRELPHVSEISGANIVPAGGKEVIKLTERSGKKISEEVGNVTNGYVPVYFSFEGDPVSIPGGYAEVFLLCGEKQGVISVPRDALIEIQGNKYVYVKEGEHDDEHGEEEHGHESHGYEKRLVKTGATNGENVEITEGLEPGETVITKGASVVRMIEVSSIAPPSHTHNH